MKRLKKYYNEPEFELIQLDFERVLTQQDVSSPEGGGSDGSEVEGEL